MRIRRESFGWEKDQQYLEVAKKSRERVVVACGSGCGRRGKGYPRKQGKSISAYSGGVPRSRGM